MNTLQIRELTSRLSRLSREKDQYVEKSLELKAKVAALRMGGLVGSTGYEYLTNKYQETLSWVFGLQPQIDKTAEELENALYSAGWG